jgi:hypothetical protein
VSALATCAAEPIATAVIALGGFALLGFVLWLAAR